jgi:nucleoside-diphosphate-sugar epimerase
MRYFLTGATGFLGGELAKQLRAQKHDVVAIVRNPAKASGLVALGVTVIQGDVTEKESMREAMQSCDGVFHVAGWYKLGVKDNSPGYRINVEGTRNVLELMQELGIKKGVYTSTLAIHSDTHGQLFDETHHFSGKHISVYDRTKAEAHKVAKQYIAGGLPLVIVMPGLIYGPDGTSLTDEAFRLYLKRKLPMISKRSAYSWGHVEDIAHAHILAMEKAVPGSTYIICGPSHTMEEAFSIANTVTGIKKPMAVPPFIIRLSASLAWLIEKFLPLPEMYASETLRVSAGVTYLGNNKKAKSELGYSPRPLDEGLKQTLTYEMKKLGM